MKFSALFLSVFLISTSILFAQNTKKSAINVIAGPSMPLGEFGNNNNNDDAKAGLAKLGAFLALEYDHQLFDDVYLTGRISGSIHGIDFAYSAPTGSALKMSTTNWKNASLLAGFSYMPKISNKLNFIGRAMLGYQHTSSPEVDINISGYFSGSSKQKSVGASSLGVLLGFGFNYDVASTVGLRLISDYGHANPKFEVSQTSSGVVNRTSTSQNIDLINLGLGISFKL